ncbi:MAG: GGDEF domain-containing protein [Acidobacteria bacterium]|nr:GGDEF domain-containing protein [Acidobacteriota bacterium]
MNHPVYRKGQLGALRIISWVFLFFAGSLPGADGFVSLREKLAGATGKDRLPPLIELAEGLKMENPRQSLEFSVEALSLLRLFPDRAVEVRLLRIAAGAQENLGDFNAALRYGYRILELARSNNDPAAYAQGQLIVGTMLARQGKYSQAIDCCNLARTWFTNLGRHERLADVYTVYGKIYDNLGDYDKSYDFFLKSLRIFEEMGDHANEASTHNNIGTLHLKSRNYSAALRSYNRALSLVDPAAQRLLSNIYNNIGALHFEKGDYPQALVFFEKVRVMESELGSEQGVAVSQCNIGAVYDRQDFPAKALELFKQCMATSRKVGDQWLLAASLTNMGSSYSKLGRFAEARESADQALALARAIMARDLVRDCCQTLSEISEREGDFRQALSYHKQVDQIQEEIVNSEKRKNFSDMRANYEIDKKAREVELLKKDRAIQDLELERSRMLRTTTLGGLAAAVGLVFLVLNRYRRKAHDARTISRINRELEEANRKLETAARTDPLTGLFNRRYIQEAAQKEIGRFQRHQHPFAVVIGDIDHFKEFNDRHGHACGDHVLKEIARTMRRFLRKQDLAGRWGGEEFIWLLPETDREGAAAVAERFRGEIESMACSFQEQDLKVTMTLGVAPFEADSDFEGCVRRADEALYRGKQAGRNQVAVGERL